MDRRNETSINNNQKGIPRRMREREKMKKKVASHESTNVSWNKSALSGCRFHWLRHIIRLFIFTTPVCIRSVEKNQKILHVCLFDEGLLKNKIKSYHKKKRKKKSPWNSCERRESVRSVLIVKATHFSSGINRGDAVGMRAIFKSQAPRFAHRRWTQSSALIIHARYRLPSR